LVTGEPQTVLIADDSITNLHVLNNILRRHYRVRATRSGQRAVEIATRDHPHAVLLDIMMPDLDGPDVCRRIKAEPELAQVPVIFITGSEDGASRALCAAAGGADLLTKPVDPQTLLEMLAAHIRAAGAPQ
jgi:putative two-component system response regulator